MNTLLKISLMVVFTGGVIMTGITADTESPYGKLSASERYIIWEKGTDLPFSGKYDTEFGRGVYTCRNCGKILYRSDDKFNSGCGWPAFDDAIPEAIRETLDADGKRTEITCANCGAHLGHVFRGEKLTAKNTRHCVNSTSLVFEPEQSKRIRRAVFAGGCFWGVEELFRKERGVLAAVSGYTGGTVDNPTYKQVCSGKTGHAEAVEIYYDPSQTTFETLCKYFLEIHDPTELNRQGPDIGTQYRSAIFFFNDQEKEIAEKLLQQLRDKGYDVKTTVEPFTKFWNAEEYHQDYYERKGTTPYCHRYQKRF